MSNKIIVIELDGKQDEYANFEGVQLLNKSIIRYRAHLNYFNYADYESFYSSTHVKEISSTKLLISLHQSARKNANIEVFDLANKERVEKIYTFDEVDGCKFTTSSYSNQSFILSICSILILRIIINYCNKYGIRRSHLQHKKELFGSNQSQRKNSLPSVFYQH